MDSKGTVNSAWAERIATKAKFLDQTMFYLCEFIDSAGRRRRHQTSLPNAKATTRNVLATVAEGSTGLLKRILASRICFNDVFMYRHMIMELNSTVYEDCSMTNLFARSAEVEERNITCCSTCSI